LTNPNPPAHLSLAQWVLWVHVVLLDPQVPLVLRVSLAPLESLVSPELLVPWVPVVLLVPLERTEMMVRLANLDAPVSVELLALRVLVDSPEPPDFPASRDTEVSAVWMELREMLAPLAPRERLVLLVITVSPVPWVLVVFLVREAAPDLLALLVLLAVKAPLVLLDPLDQLDLLVPLDSPVVLALRERLVLREAVDLRDPREPVVSLVTQDLLDLLGLLVPPDLMVFLVLRVLLVLWVSLVLLVSLVLVVLLELRDLLVLLVLRVTPVTMVPLDLGESLVPRESLAQLDFRDLLAPLVRRAREDLVESPVVLDPVDPLESVVPLVLVVCLVLMEVLVAREPLVSVVPLALLDLREPLVSLETPVLLAHLDQRV